MCVSGEKQDRQEDNYVQASIYGGPGDAIYEARVRPNNAAIANVQARIDKRNKLLEDEKHPLVAGLYNYENYRAGKLIENLNKGDRAVKDAKGNTVGTRNAYNQLTGRDPELDAQRAARYDEKQQDRDAAKDLAERQAAAAKKRKEEAAASESTTTTPNTNRRQIIYEDQRLSSSSSRGSGRRSLFG